MTVSRVISQEKGLYRLVSSQGEKWEEVSGCKAKWVNQYDGGPHEANFLKLDCSKIKKILGWKPQWNIEQTMGKLVEWYYQYAKNENIIVSMEKDIKEILGRVI